VKRVAAVDIGTNSVRLLVAEVDGTSPRDAKVVPIDRRMRITRLGQGVDKTRALAPEAIERTVAVLREYRAALDEHGVSGVRATADLDAPAPYLVVDIGGGSTEFVLGTDAPTGLVSLDMGCVRITEQYLESDPPAPEELSNAVAAVRDLVADVPRITPGATEAATLVGLAGTVTTVAAVELGIPEYDPEKIHHFVLTRDAAEDVFRTLATENAEQRAHNPGLEPGRVDVIVGGTAVLVGIFRTLGFGQMLVSEADILDGLVRSQVS